MDVLIDSRVQTKKEFDHMSLCLEDIANEIEELFKFQSNALRNMAKKLSAITT